MRVRYAVHLRHTLLHSLQIALIGTLPGNIIFSNHFPTNYSMFTFLFTSYWVVFQCKKRCKLSTRFFSFSSIFQLEISCIDAVFLIFQGPFSDTRDQARAHLSKSPFVSTYCYVATRSYFRLGSGNEKSNEALGRRFSFSNFHLFRCLMDRREGHFEAQHHLVPSQTFRQLEVARTLLNPHLHVTQFGCRASR